MVMIYDVISGTTIITLHSDFPMVNRPSTHIIIYLIQLYHRRTAVVNEVFSLTHYFIQLLSG